MLVLDSSARLIAAAPAGAEDDLAGWPGAHKAELAELRKRGLLASSSMADAQGSVSLHPLGARGRVRGFLAVGTAGPLDRNRQSVVAVAVSLLSIAMEQGGASSLGGQDVRAATLRLLLAGAAPDELPLRVLGWNWLAQTPLRVVVSRGTPAQRADALLRLEGLADAMPAVVVDTGAELVVVVADDEAQLVRSRRGVPRDRCRGERARARDRPRPGPRRGGPGPGCRARRGHPLVRPARGRRDARRARPGGGARRRRRPAGTARGPQGRPASTPCTRGCSRHGQWDTAAADLGVHRHTLRYRMRRVEELLGRSLDDADLRAELWLALRLRGQTLPGG